MLASRTVLGASPFSLGCWGWGAFPAPMSPSAGAELAGKENLHVHPLLPPSPANTTIPIQGFTQRASASSLLPSLSTFPHPHLRATCKHCPNTASPWGIPAVPTGPVVRRSPEREFRNSILPGARGCRRMLSPPRASRWVFSPFSLTAERKLEGDADMCQQSPENERQRRRRLSPAPRGGWPLLAEITARCGCEREYCFNYCHYIKAGHLIYSASKGLN